MQQYLQNKKELVQNVFDKVYDQYDLMNDFMSLGVHRIWKKSLLNMMNPSNKHKFIDVGCGTGDIAKLLLNHIEKNASITCVDPNKKAESLPIKNNTFDFYTISFGLRNTKDLNKSLSEAYRVLKSGGRFLCLEFSKIQNSNLDKIYKSYSKFIPSLGKLIVGEKEPYEYLVKSIENFVNQEELIELMKKNKFKKCTYRNLSGGIVSIHSGWKI